MGWCLIFFKSTTKSWIVVWLWFIRNVNQILFIWFAQFCYIFIYLKKLPLADCYKTAKWMLTNQSLGAYCKVLNQYKQIQFEMTMHFFKWQMCNCLHFHFSYHTTTQAHWAVHFITDVDSHVWMYYSISYLCLYSVVFVCWESTRSGNFWSMWNERFYRWCLSVCISQPLEKWCED